MTSSERLLNVAIEQLRSPVRVPGPPPLAPIPTLAGRSEAFIEILYLTDAIPVTCQPHQCPIRQFGILHL